MNIRTCPLCDVEINYNHQTSFCRACKLNSKCKDCRIKMNKSLEKRERLSTTQKKRFENPEERNKVAVRQKKYWSNPTIRQKQSEKLKGKMKGEKNPFFGKTHTPETKTRISQVDKSYTKTQKFKEKMSKVTSGLNNPNYGISNYQRWVSKHGEEKAKELEKNRIQKMANSMKGSGNPMFGKPRPHGVGNGWSGWYKGWFFRSLHELSYMIKVIEKNKMQWRSAECSDLKIMYIGQDGHQHGYFADFLLEGNKLIEVKPSRLRSLCIVEIKKQAAEIFCKDRGYQYVIDACDILSNDELDEIHTAGLVKFTAKYEAVFKSKKFRKHRN